MQNKFKKNIDKHYNLFQNFIEIKDINQPILKGTLPPLIFSQLEHISSEIKLIKKQEFSFLKDNLHNIDNFEYKPFIPNYLIEPTFILEYIKSLGAYFVGKYSNMSFNTALLNTKVNKIDHNSTNDCHDIWINYSSKNNYSKLHNHQGDLSGIIFLENTKVSNTIFSSDKDFSFNGSPGEILIFPSTLSHKVSTNLEELERVTVAFNLIILNK